MQLYLEPMTRTDLGRVSVYNLRDYYNAWVKCRFDAVLPDGIVRRDYQFSISSLGKPFIFDKSPKVGLWVPKRSSVARLPVAGRNALEGVLLSRFLRAPGIGKYLNPISMVKCEHGISQTFYCEKCEDVRESALAFYLDACDVSKFAVERGVR